MTKTITSALVTALCISLFISCRPSYYVARDFDSKTTTHKKVAVIPVEMSMTGQKPKKLTEAQIDSIENYESLQFQASLFNNLLKYSNTKKGIVSVEFQSYERTNKILEEHGMKLRDAWTADPVTLCKVLGVDAIVKMRVVKQRYMSDLASYGVQMAGNVLGQLGGPAGWTLASATRNGRTNDINAECSLFNNAEGEVLWKDMHKGAADWNSPANQIIENITVRFARNFPYRKKSK